MLYGIDDRSEKIAHPMNRDRGLPWGWPEKKNDLFASLKGSIFYCPFAFNRRRLTLPGNKKTTAGFPAMVIFLLSG